jgi:biopolymer transport protein ExbB
MPEIITQTGPLLAPLLIISLMGLALIVERLLFFMRLPKPDQNNEYEALQSELEANAHLSKPMRDEIISCRLLDVKEHLEFGIRLLRFIAVLSPMLGLLGTVLGMIDAFRDISAHDGPVTPAMISDGLWSAMMTTAYGLIIALPCLFAAFVYARKAEKYLGAIQKKLNIRSLEMEGAKLS